MKKRATQRPDFTDLALERLEKIMASEQTSDGYKMIALMTQAAEICARKDLPEPEKKLDLFTGTKADPYEQCVKYFTSTLQHAQADKEAGGKFDPLETVKYGQTDTSVLSFAYQMKKKQGKQHPELRTFLKNIEKTFPDEVAEDKNIEQRIAEDEKQLAADAKLYKSGKLATKAGYLANKPIDSSQLYVLLMNHAAQAYQTNPVLDLKKPYGNPELLVALARTGKNDQDAGMLYHIKTDAVKPNQNVRDPITGEPTTPMKFAEQMADTQGLEDLGRIFRNRLTDHADALKLYAERPQVFELGYQRKRKPT